MARVAVLFLLALWVPVGAFLAQGQPPLQSEVPDVAPQCGCPAGNVSDCCCSFAELEETNQKTVHDLLKRVVATPFFGHFRVSMCSHCRLWQDHSMCTLRDCSVCECEAPPTWALDKEEVTEAEDCGWQPQISQGVEIAPALGHAASSWVMGESPEGEAEVVVDLRANPERYTGYAGTNAARVWDEVHNKNCFQIDTNVQAEGEHDSTSTCVLSAAQRIYNRLVSGLHSSISLHIAHDYCLQRSTTAIAECAVWGPNATLAHERVLQHPERVENLFVAFAVLLRAVVRAGDAVTVAVPRDDAEFAESLREWEEALLPEVRRLASSCPKSFAEDDLLAGPGADEAWREIEARSKHMAEIMRCVGCDRCKLWGTMQTQGLAVALRVLFEPASEAPALTREEAVVLVHTLERLSSSLQYIRQFRERR